MIDLHCHLLPGIDDGPESMDEALEIARASVADGITHAVLTSHVNPDRYPNKKRNLEKAVAEFADALAKAAIPLQVRMGGEARLCPELMDLIAEGEVPFLGEVKGWRILLLEFPHQVVPVGSLRFVQSLLRQNIRPLIAHPERNKAIMGNTDKIREFVEAGCWLQITAGSLSGRFGSQAQQVAFKLLDEGCYSLIATDAHNTSSRPPVLSEGRAALELRYGEATATAMAVTRPAQIFGLAQ